MIGFWISAVAMAGMVALVLLLALWRARGQTDGVAPDMAVYRDQLAEVDRDLARGTLTAAEGERLRVEVQRRMLEADRISARLVAPPPSRLLPMVAGLVVLALGTAGWIYQSLGVPGYPDLPLSDRLANADAAYNARPTQEQAEAGQPAFVQPVGLDPMIPKLRAALATRPDDLQGHVLLAQNEAALGDFAATRRAQEVVVRLKAADAGPDDLAFLAYAMVRAAGGLVTPEAEKVVIDLLQIDPRNGWGRFYSGLMFAEIGRPDRTFALWEPLLAESGPDAPWHLPIRSQIADIAAAAGVNYTLPEEQAAPEMAARPDAAPGPDAAAIAGASAMSETDRNAMIANMVDGLEARLNTEGGSVEEWSRLITSLSVLQKTDRAQTAYVAAQAAFAGKPGELSALHAAATQAGIAP